MDTTFDDERAAFAEAAAWFAGLVAAVGDRWEQPGLGEWDVRALVGHTSRALLTVETYLGRPAAQVEVPTAPAYYRAARLVVGGADVTERGREAGRALGADPVGAVADLVARVVPLLAARDGSELVTTVVGGMRLDAYLPTRVLELVVHGADLAVALDLPADVPATASLRALRLAAEVVAVDGGAVPVLRALTGRSALPPGFSVV